MTRPQWVTQRLQQGEAALWSGNQDNGPDSTSSSHGLPPEEAQLPLHATLQPSLEHIEAFLADEAKEMEHLAAQHLLTLSQNHPSTASETSSQEQERLRQEEEYEQTFKDQEANEEDQDEDYWKQYYEQLYWARLLSLADTMEFLVPRMTWRDAAIALGMQKVVDLSSLTNFSSIIWEAR